MKKIIIIVVAAVVLIGGGIGVFLYMSSQPEKEKELLYHQMEEMYTNIPTGVEGEADKILKLQITVVYTEEKYADEVLLKRNDEIKSMLIRYFRDSSQEIATRRNGLERIQEELREQMIELLGTDEDNIREILTPQFIIQ